MKRAQFLHSLAALWSAACAQSLPPPRPLQKAAPEPAPGPAPEAQVVKRRFEHWAWLTANTELPDVWYQREFQRMAEAGVSSILAEAFNGTEAFYQSAHLPTRGDWLGRVQPLAKAAGLEVHAWVWCMPCNVEAVLTQTPEWFMVNKNGESTSNKPVYLPNYRFLCPSRPEVRAFIQRRVQELLEYPLDGVHLDYVQFPHVILPPGLQAQYGVKQEEEQAEYDFCYCEVCRLAFKSQTKIDPLDFNQPGHSDAWKRFRYACLNDLVNRDLVPLIRKAGKLASAAVLPDWEHARQEWRAWELDVAFPLLYHALYTEDLSWIGFQTQESVERLASGIACYSGLLVSHLSPPDLTGAIRVALESGARGVGLFSGQAMSELHWEAFRRAVEEAEAELLAGQTG